MTTALERRPAEAHDAEHEALRQLDAALRTDQAVNAAKLVGADGKEAAIPEPLLQVLRQAAHFLAQHKLVSQEATGAHVELAYPA